MYNIIYSQDVLTTFGSIKERLRSGEMAVCGDQWPIFLYDGYSYDPEDPWNGLFRSALLVSVSFAITRFCQWAQDVNCSRPTNIFLRLPVLLTRSRKPHGPEMPVFTG
jgi:hypothetical protein